MEEINLTKVYFIRSLMALCHVYGFYLRPSDPYESIDISSDMRDISYLEDNLPSDLPF